MRFVLKKYQLFGVSYLSPFATPRKDDVSPLNVPCNSLHNHQLCHFCQPLSQSPIMSQFWHHPVWTNFCQITAIPHWPSWCASVHGLCIWVTCIWYSLMCFLCWECVFLSVLLCVRLYRGVSWVLSPSKSGWLTASTATGGGAVTSFFGFVNRINIQKFYLGWVRDSILRKNCCSFGFWPNEWGGACPNISSLFHKCIFGQ